MRNKTSYIVGLILLIAIVAAVVVWQSNQEKLYDAKANVNLVQIKKFHISSDSTELKTFAEGTMFVQGSNGSAEQVQIVAQIEVDPNDWGGVAFYIPHDWYISEITSSFPEKSALKPLDYMSRWTTADTDSKWRAWVEIGRDRSYKPIGGGKGTIVIDVVPDKKMNPSAELFNLGIEVGSAEKDGQKLMGTDSIEVPIW
ncbi:hypothetical protein DMN77_17980 [Paenibacillus sp. 79R4]|uniref:hypothetical protein n=1 Tax=Paenibacillus sp. 79R4 TaxID=2212847 RepID=UPI0015B996B3|nr:hypothetical protein [Paenibacillus sp. 79R4]NWL89445.1 hypothetical protein [Paenibacillus sp. 79R4]